MTFLKSLILQIKADIQAFPMIYLSFFNFENPLSCIKFLKKKKKRVFLIGTVHVHTVPHFKGLISGSEDVDKPVTLGTEVYCSAY